VSMVMSFREGHDGLALATSALRSPG
jgi:hypothetical protein